MRGVRGSGLRARAIRVAVVGAGAAMSVVVGVGLVVPVPASASPLRAASLHYPGDPKAEAALVGDENARLDQLRSTAGNVAAQGAAARPVLSGTGDDRALILPPSPQPYTLDGLQKLAPNGLRSIAPGVWSLSVTLVVARGATLSLSAPTPTRLELTSSPGAFVSIVSFGGTLAMSGTPQADLRVSTRDAWTGEPDTDTRDGRAYIRAIGGTFRTTDVTFDHLGFWSGNTGGVAVTGTRAARSDDPSADELTDAAFVDTTFRQNAYGLFVSSASEVTITDCTAAGNLIHGIAFHRHVTDSTIASTTVEDNAGDGIAVNRGSSGIRVERSVVADNGRDGIAVDGRPISTGPNAAGSAADESDSIAIAASEIESNGRYAVRLRDGDALHVHDNRISGTPNGIDISGGATDVTVSSNTIVDTTEHAIEVSGSRDSIVVVGNTVSQADTGVYLRDAAARVTGNTIHRVTRHGVAMVGATAGTRITTNSIAGQGTSPIDARRTTGNDPVITGNVTTKWALVAPLDVIIRRVLQPLNVMWALLVVIVAITATGYRRSRKTGIRDPFAYLTPLQQLSRGFAVPPTDAGNGVGRHRTVEGAITITNETGGPREEEVQR